MDLGRVTLCMTFIAKQTYHKHEVTTWSVPNHWDILAIAIIFAVIVLVAIGAKQMAAAYHLGDAMLIHLDPSYLPVYALRTTMRLFVALFLSLIFTFIVGSWAAKNHRAEQLIIPTVDILQSVPVLSFLTITASGFILLFKNSMLGPECAAIFGIFTAQVWNMILSFYQSIKTIPKEIKEVASIFQLSPWQRFWRVEVPYSMSGLLWNMMMSMSGSWFFVIACEAFSVSGSSITLPGVGSYIWLAIMQADRTAIVYAITCMLIVIFLYDQLLFRPLLYWTEQFREQIGDEEKIPRVWLVTLFQKTKLIRSIIDWFSKISDALINLKILNRKKFIHSNNKFLSIYARLGYLILTTLIISLSLAICLRLLINLSVKEAKDVFILGLFTGTRVMILIFISSLIWLPIGVWIGLRPHVSAIIQPIIQFVAAFPANLLFPIATMLIMRFNLNAEIWVAPLMVLCTQWYILFNVIAGTSQLPKELKLAADNFKVKGWLWWKRFILPGIAPSFITGAITAAGGAWNASIVAEVITWGQTKLTATWIGAYIKINSESGDFLRVALGTVVMCIIVLLINRLFWKPLYDMAMDKIN